MIDWVFVGDGDELDSMNEVERVFGIKPTDDEWSACRTMGDVEAVIWRHVSQRGDAGNRCMTAMAFHELRRAFAAPDAPRSIGPQTPVAAFGMNAVQFHQRLSQATGLRLNSYATILGTAGLLACFAGVIASGAFGLRMIFRPSPETLSSFAMALSSVMLGWLAARFDPGSFHAARTMGDMARRLADSNFAAFAARGGRYSRDDVWRVVREVAAGETGDDPDEIGRDTLACRQRRRWFEGFRRS